LPALLAIVNWMSHSKGVMEMIHVRTLLIALMILCLGRAVCLGQPQIGDKPQLAFRAVDGQHRLTWKSCAAGWC